MIGEIIAGLFAVILSIVAIFVVPTQALSANINNSVQTIVNEAATDFIDQTRAQGYITTRDYDELMYTLENTGNTYDINVELLEQQYYSDGNGGYISTLVPTTDIELSDYLHPATGEEMIYKMDAGDYIQIQIIQTNVNASQRLSNIFMPGAVTSSEISVRYGGLVGNEMS